MKIGVDLLANAVKVTLGAKGRTVAIGSRPVIGANGKNLTEKPKVTKDGVTVARAVFISDPIEAMGAGFVLDAAERTVEEAGDATTTSTILTQSLIENGMQVVDSEGPVALQRRIMSDTQLVVSEIKKRSRPVDIDSDDLLNVATISANGDVEIGKLISDAIKQVGKDGEVRVELSQSSKSSSEIISGMKIKAGMINPVFTTQDKKTKSELDGVNVLAWEGRIDDINDLVPFLDMLVNQPNPKPLVIFTDDLQGAPENFLILNHANKAFPSCVVLNPYNGAERVALFEDICTYTGATLLSKDRGNTLATVTLSQLGTAEKITTDMEKCVILGGGGKVDDAVKLFTEQKESEQDTEALDLLKTRISRLSCGVAVIYVGASTKTEGSERMDRVDDCYHAVKAAMEEGVVAGGGATLLRIAEHLKDQIHPVTYKALISPIKQILTNCGEEKIDVAAINQKGQNFGYNAVSGKIEDMIASGILDPAKVVRVALENAASVAGTFLTTEVVIA